MQVVVFSWTRCPFCVKAKRELANINAKYLAVELDTMADGNAIRSELGKVRMHSLLSDRCCAQRTSNIVSPLVYLSTCDFIVVLMHVQRTNRTSMPNIFIAGKGEWLALLLSFVLQYLSSSTMTMVEYWHDVFELLPGIGGCNDGPGLMTLQRKGELVTLLKSAGAL